jgi:hypothetical protein
MGESVFMGIYSQFEIHAAAQSLPATWDPLWNPDNLTVI